MIQACQRMFVCEFSLFPLITSNEMNLFSFFYSSSISVDTDFCFYFATPCLCSRCSMSPLYFVSNSFGVSIGSCKDAPCFFSIINRLLASGFWSHLWMVCQSFELLQPAILLLSCQISIFLKNRPVATNVPHRFEIKRATNVADVTMTLDFFPSSYSFVATSNLNRYTKKNVNNRNRNGQMLTATTMAFFI